jgi:hypothetical protein
MHQRDSLVRFLSALIDQDAARILVAPQESAPGFWFGGGNAIRVGADIFVSGRYRNHGDSRTGLHAGERGLECAIFRSQDGSQSFEKVQSWSKADLSVHGRVVSIEGTALHVTPDGVELFISTEQAIDYPAEFAEFQKPGTGVWRIDVMSADSIANLAPSSLAPVLSTTDPAYLHIKDPVVYDCAEGTALVFCHHPFCWSSSNSGLAIRPHGAAEFAIRDWEMVSRGPAWDVACTRITCQLPVPRVGVFADSAPASIFLYDGAECLREMPENKAARRRPRGHSCEELGGAFFGWDADFPTLTRLSRLRPLFVSPHATGCSRYTQVLDTGDGLLAIWQQAQADGSQPLVGHYLSHERITELLG